MNDIYSLYLAGQENNNPYCYVVIYLYPLCKDLQPSFFRWLINFFGGAATLRVLARREAFFSKDILKSGKSPNFTNDCTTGIMQKSHAKCCCRLFEPLFFCCTVASEGKGDWRWVERQQKSRANSSSFNDILHCVRWNPAAGEKSRSGWPSNWESPLEKKKKKKDGKWNHIPRGRFGAGRAA